MQEQGHDPSFEAVLHHLRDARGFDFTGYKRSSLTRRIRKRMADIGVDSYETYLDHLEVHPDELEQLFDTVLINVTGFFRDPETWAVLASEVVPRIVADGGPRPIRVWSAACASGQEVYSIAMLLCEALGTERFLARVKIYGTDVDEADLGRARQAQYREEELDEVPEDLRERYFEPTGDGTRQFRSDLRRAVIFGRHDLVQDPPISRLDLLICRNTLIYFNADLQRDILRRFHFALRDEGILFLGRSESLLTYNDLYEPVAMKHRIFARVPRDDQPLPGQSFTRPDVNGGRATGARDLVAAAFDAASVAQIIVNGAGLLVAANNEARRLFDLHPSDLGRPLRDLDVSYRPVDLRSLIDRTRGDGQKHAHAQTSWLPPGKDEPIHLEVTVGLLDDSAPAGSAIAVLFEDVTARRRLEEDLQSTNRELERAYEDLQSTNEELETTNEELQSTNEELETMNEELQSTNEELETINDALHERTEELHETNAHLASILRGIRGAVVVVDREMTVQTWSDSAEDLWGARGEEVVGRDLRNLDIGLDTGELTPALRRCLDDASEFEEVEVAAHDRRGRDIVCRVRVTPIVTNGSSIGLILLMESAELEGS